MLHAPSCRAKVDKLIRLLKPIKGCIKLCDHDVVCTSKVIEGFNEVRKVVSAWDGPKHVKDAASDAIEDRYCGLHVLHRAFRFVLPSISD